ncbi:MAG: Surface lipoprotein assembly modifier [Acidobacteriota bacterium]|jgi:hypothetical protein|nr:Surface lipoprotein assembly modifier [Acidobacteriota bacterium]
MKLLCGDRRKGFRLVYLLLVMGCAAAGRQPATVPSTAGALTALAHGILAFNHGEDREAAALLEEAVRLDPREGTAYHWLGLVYLQLDRSQEAIDQLQVSLQAEHPPAAGRERVLSDLRAAREVLERKQAPPAFVEPAYGPVALSFEELPRWDVRIGLESAYDSNAALLAESLPFAVPGLAHAGEVPSDLVAALNLRVAGHPFYDRRGWSLGLSFDGNQSLHQDLGDLDLSVARGIASLAWGRSPFGIATGPLGYTRVPSGGSRIRVLLQGGGSFTWLDGRSYLRSGEGALSFAVPESSWGETRIEVKSRDRDFSNEEGVPRSRRLSGSETSAGLGQLFFLGGGRSLRLDLATGRSHAGRVFDSSFDEAGAKVTAPLADRWTLFLLGGLRQDRFENPESNVTQPTGREREDDTWRIAAAVLWQIDEHLSWTVRGSHARRDSIVELAGSPLFDYRRNVVSVGFQWKP